MNINKAETSPSSEESAPLKAGGGKSPVGLYGVKAEAQIIGPYKILEILGHGGQATVYRALDTRVRRIVALKALSRTVGQASESLLRFRQEAELTAKLDHPAICPIYEVGLDAVPFIAMKLVEGKTLAKAISTAKTRPTSGPTEMPSFVDLQVSDGVSQHLGGAASAPPSTDDRQTPRTASGTPQGREQVFDILKVIEQIARALHVAHEAGIIHRDIKPGNLMIQKDGTPIILDFGLAYQEDHAGPSLSETGQLFGTPAYMAPEQIAAKRMRVDRRADIYSLGVTLFECLTLERPFEAPSREALYQAITFKDPPDPKKLNAAVSTDLKVVLLKALEKDPDVRFQTALEFAEELRRIRAFEPIATRPVSVFTRHVRWVQRNPGWAVAVYGIFVALSMAVGVFYFKNAQLDRTNTELDHKNTELDRTIIDLRNERASVAQKTAEALANAARAESESTAKGVALAEKSATLTEKTRAVDDYERLADSTLFAQAKDAADQLVPVRPELVAKIEAWQQTYRPLFLHLVGHEATLAKLREAAAPYTDASRAKDYPKDAAELSAMESAATEARAKASAAKSNAKLDDDAEDAEDAAKAATKAYLSKPRRSADFGDDTKTQFKHDVLSKLVEEMRAFTDPKTGALSDVEARLVKSREIKKKTIDDHAKEWEEAIARIATNPKYNGQRLWEQVGLIPLGADKDSTLEEFYETETGLVPQRDEQGKIIVTEKVAMVFVLIPGGSFQMGAQSEDKTDLNYDPGAYDTDGPVHEVTLSAYFLSKYEMTQGQWMRTSKEDRPNPSHWVLANYPADDSFTTHLRFPVEGVSWDDSRERLRRLGYDLPTEAQWEYACRAGTHTPWSSGNDAKSLEKCANVADRSNHRAFATNPYDETIDDKHATTSAVGAFVANGFGLHDMHGNVWEWCEDAYGDYSAAPHREGDGLRLLSDAPTRVLRGSSFNVLPQYARSAYRFGLDPSHLNITMGVRASRRIMAP